MTCHRIVQNGVFVGYACTRGRGAKAHACACGRTATRLCDGRVRTPTNRTRRCDRPLCDTHATSVGEDRDLCPDCRAAEAPAPAPAGALVSYTDGSGTLAHLPCGAGVVVYDGELVILEASRHLGLGTNNHAEVSAVRVALAITESYRDRLLVVRTDSQYTIGALTAPADPEPWAANAKLLGLVRRAMVGRALRFEHVKGHAGIAGNERADVLAGLARLRGPALRKGAA